MLGRGLCAGGSKLLALPGQVLVVMTLMLTLLLLL